tara:strand:- start:279 stop:419 length:141 start_codon:yes stop_codon:yes gene_type:complete
MVVLLVVSEEEVGPSESARKEFPLGWHWGGEIAAMTCDLARSDEAG